MMCMRVRCSPSILNGYERDLGPGDGYGYGCLRGWDPLVVWLSRVFVARVSRQLLRTHVCWAYAHALEFIRMEHG